MSRKSDLYNASRQILPPETDEALDNDDTPVEATVVRYPEPWASAGMPRDGAAADKPLDQADEVEGSNSSRVHTATFTDTPKTRATRSRRIKSADLDAFTSHAHMRFPRGQASWSASFRIPPRLIAELEAWKWRYFLNTSTEPLNTRILTVALERLSAEDLVRQEDSLRAADPTGNTQWATRVPASMRPVIVELAHSCQPPLDKSQVAVAAITKFLQDFADLAPEPTEPSSVASVSSA